MIEFAESNAVVKYQDYTAFDKAFREEIEKHEESFVRIGYMLKVARDTDVLRSSGYKTVFEYAKDMYGLDATTVSRYISINDTYSISGYSPELDDKYKSFGYAKLSEMLTLPPAIVEELEPGMTREDIRTIKKEYQEEQKISDIEVAIERAEVINQEKASDDEVKEISIYEPNNNLEKLIYGFFKNPDHADEFVSLSAAEPYQIKELFEWLAPSGTRTIIGRIPGEGRMQLTLKSPDQKISVVNYRSGQTDYYMWDDVAEYVNKLVVGEGSGRDKYKKVFGEDYPVSSYINNEKEKAAAVDPEKSEKTREKPKLKKVEVVKPKAEKKPAEKKEKKPEDKQEEKTEEKPEESLEVKQEEPEMVLTVEKEPEKADEEPKTEDSGSYEEENKIPAEAWHQRFLPYYEEWKTFIDKCNQCLYDVAEKDADPKDYRYLVKMADEYYRKASEELEKIRQLPEVEI